MMSRALGPNPVDLGKSSGLRTVRCELLSAVVDCRGSRTAEWCIYSHAVLHVMGETTLSTVFDVFRLRVA